MSKIIILALMFSIFALLLVIGLMITAWIVIPQFERQDTELNLSEEDLEGFLVSSVSINEKSICEGVKECCEKGPITGDYCDVIE